MILMFTVATPLISCYLGRERIQHTRRKMRPIQNTTALNDEDYTRNDCSN